MAFSLALVAVFLTIVSVLLFAVVVAAGVLVVFVVLISFVVTFVVFFKPIFTFGLLSSKLKVKLDIFSTSSFQLCSATEACFL